MVRLPPTEMVKSKLPDYLGGMTAVGVRNRKTGRTSLLAYTSPDGKRSTLVRRDILSISRPRTLFYVSGAKIRAQERRK